MSLRRRGMCILLLLMFSLPLPAASPTPVPIDVTPSGTVTFPEGGGTRVLDLTVPSDGLVKGTTLSVTGSPVYANRTWSATAEELWAAADSRENLTLGPDGIGLGGFGSWWEEEGPELGFSEGVDTVSIRSPELNVSAHSLVIVDGVFPNGSSYSVEALDPAAGDAVLAGGLRNGDELPASIWSGMESPYRDLALRLEVSRARPGGTPTVTSWGVGTGWRAGPESCSWAGDAVASGGQVELGQQAEWVEAAPSSPPTGRVGAELVYSPLDGTVLMWGGESDGGIHPTGMFSYSPADDSWTDVTPAAAPPGRRDHAMAYDTLRNRVYMFGGVDASGGRDDMWAYTPATNTWAELSPMDPPAARWAHSMAYVPGQDVVVLFGGVEGTTQAGLGDTWFYHPATNAWERRTPATSPPSRAAASMVYDEDAGIILLFGGRNGTTFYDDVWEYDMPADRWLERCPASRPPARADACMAYDTALDETVLSMGTAGPAGPLLGDTWVYNNTRDEWTDLTSPPRPPAREAAGMAYVPGLELSVVFGGSDVANACLSDTWTIEVGHVQSSHVLTTALSPILHTYGTMRVDASLPAGTRYWVDVTDEAGAVLCPALANGDPIAVDATEHPAIRLDLVLWTDDPGSTPVVREWGYGTDVWVDMRDDLHPNRPIGLSFTLPPRNAGLLDWTKEEGVRLDNSSPGDGFVLDGPFDVVRLDDGGYRMYYSVAYRTTGGHRILSATSEDGFVWQGEAGVRLDRGGGSGFEGLAVMGPRILPLSNGSLRMFYTCTNEAGGVPCYTASALSGDGLCWTKEGLRLGPGGRTDGYDDAGAGGGYWLEPFPGGYRMFYVGLDADQGHKRILSAVSPDAEGWSKEPSVRIDLGTAADLEDGAVRDPVVVHLANGTLRMFYSCNGGTAGDVPSRVRSATSTNMVGWVKDAGARIVPGGPYDANGPSLGGRVFLTDRGYRLYYLASSSDGDAQVLSARSSLDCLTQDEIQAGIDLGNEPYAISFSWDESRPVGTSITVGFHPFKGVVAPATWVNVTRDAECVGSDLSPLEGSLQYHVVLRTSVPNRAPLLRGLVIRCRPFSPGGALADGVAVSVPGGRVVSARPELAVPGPEGATPELWLSADRGSSWQAFENGTSSDLEARGDSLGWRVVLRGDGGSPPRAGGLTLSFTVAYLPADLMVDVGADGTAEWRHDGALDARAALDGIVDSLNAYISTHRGEAVGGAVTVPVALTSTTAGTVELGDAIVEFVPSPRIVDHGPTGKGVPLDSPISLSFDTGVELDSHDVTIAPGLDFALELTEGSTLATVVHGGLEENTTYTVAVAPGAPSLEGAPLLEGLSWSFTTLPVNPTVIRRGPEGGDVGPDDPISVRFDRPMRPDSLAVDISPPTGLSPSWSTDGRELTLGHPVLLGSTTYTVTVRAGALTARGTPLLDDVSWGFTTRPVELAIVGYGPTGAGVGLDDPVIIAFLLPVDLDTIVLSITPQVELDGLPSGSTDRLSMSHAPYKEGTTYTATIKAGARGASGEILLRDLSWTFTTAAGVERSPAVGGGDPSPMRVAAIGSAVVLIFIGAFASTEYGGFSLMSLLLPLYARARKAAVLDNKTRFALHGVIIENPGIHYQALAKALDISNGAAMYHLGVLEREGYIKTCRDGMLKRFYSDTAKIPSRRKMPPEELRARIIDLVEAESGLTQKAVSERMGLDREVVGYHLRALVSEGRLRASRVGRYTIYAPAQRDEQPD